MSLSPQENFAEGRLRILAGSPREVELNPEPDSADQGGMAPPGHARPFVKWAGGKTQLLGQIGGLIPARIRGRYFEPFLGSGAVFLHLWSTGRIEGGAVLSDASRPLVDTWLAIQRDADEVIRVLTAHRDAHHRDARGHFYSVRDSEPDSSAERAARFIYLNKTCFNGLWRVNRKGRFNVPMGSYVKPTIFEPENLRLVSKALSSAEIACHGFEVALNRMGRDDVAYLDPPYQPLSTTSSFTAYTAEGFGDAEQVRLADACARIRSRGAYFVLSNHDTPRLERLYRSRRFRFASIQARRSINCDPNARAGVSELLVVDGRRGARTCRMSIASLTSLSTDPAGAPK